MFGNTNNIGLLLHSRAYTRGGGQSSLPTLYLLNYLLKGEYDDDDDDDEVSFLFAWDSHCLFPFPSHSQTSTAKQQRVKCRVDSGATEKQFREKLDVSRRKVKILKTPFAIRWKSDTIFLQSSFEMLCQLQWKSTTVTNPWKFSPMGIRVIPIPICVYSHSLPFPSWSLIPITMRFPLGYFDSHGHLYVTHYLTAICRSVAEWLACWTQAQKGLGSNRSRDAVG